MEQLINKFDFNGHSVRIITNEKDQVFFIAKDVCDILGYSNTSKAISDNCKKEGVTNGYIPHPQSDTKQIEVTLINEGNLYRLAIKSKKRESEKFESWVCDEVLPNIRKTGRYEVKPKPQPEVPSTFLESLKLLVEREEANQKLQIENAEMKPKVEYLEKEIFGSESDMTTTTIAKNFGMSAIELNKILHSEGVQYFIDGIWVLYAKFQNQGFMKLHTFKKDNKTYHNNKWTEKGRSFVTSIIKKHFDKLNNSQLLN